LTGYVSVLLFEEYRVMWNLLSTISIRLFQKYLHNTSAVILKFITIITSKYF